MFERGAKGFMHRLLGEIEIAEEPNQGSENAARFGAVDRIHRLLNCNLVHASVLPGITATAPFRVGPVNITAGT
jgi:hypothetical protein